MSIYEFLEIQATPPVDPSEKFAGDYLEPMSAEDRDFLKGLYRYEIKSLEQMLRWDCSDWLA